MEFLTGDPVAQADHLPASDVRRAGTTLRPLRLRYCRASEPDLMVQLAGLRLRERYQDRDRGPFTGRARTASRSARSPQRLPDERGRGDRLRDERGVRAVDGVGRGAHPLRHEPFRVRRDRVVVPGDQEPGRLGLPARRRWPFSS